MTSVTSRRPRGQEQTAILAGVPFGGVVEVDGNWGVKCISPVEQNAVPRGYCVVDFWDSGREYVPDRTNVIYQRGTGSWRTDG